MAELLLGLQISPIHVHVGSMYILSCLTIPPHDCFRYSLYHCSHPGQNTLNPQWIVCNNYLIRSYSIFTFSLSTAALCMRRCCFSWRTSMFSWSFCISSISFLCSPSSKALSISNCSRAQANIIVQHGNLSPSQVFNMNREQLELASGNILMLGP